MILRRWKITVNAPIVAAAGIGSSLHLEANSDIIVNERIEVDGYLQMYSGAEDVNINVNAPLLSRSSHTSLQAPEGFIAVNGSITGSTQAAIIADDFVNNGDIDSPEIYIDSNKAIIINSPISSDYVDGSIEMLADGDINVNGSVNAPFVDISSGEALTVDAPVSSSQGDGYIGLFADGYIDLFADGGIVINERVEAANDLYIDNEFGFGGISVNAPLLSGAYVSIYSSGEVVVNSSVSAPGSVGMQSSNMRITTNGVVDSSNIELNAYALGDKGFFFDFANDIVTEGSILNSHVSDQSGEIKVLANSFVNNGLICAGSKFPAFL